MKTKSTSILIVMFSTLAFLPGALAQTNAPAVVTSPPVEGEKLSQEYTVTVEGKDVPVDTAQLDPGFHKTQMHMDDTYSFASFECSGPVTVVIHSTHPLTSLTIRPNGAGIPIKLDGNNATFTLEHNGNFLIERNGNGRKDPLLLFANPLETNVPKEGDPGVVYLGPGRHNAGFINLTSNQTLYIADGALVTGAVIARGDNIKISGRGLLENDGGPYNGKDIIWLDHCTHVTVEGITLRKNSQFWTVKVQNCDGVNFSDLKICGAARGNDDGIDPVNTRNMVVQDCFIRTKDDCMAFKGIGDRTQNCENITVTGTSLWSDQCCTLLFGDESMADHMRNITFKDCHVLFLSPEGIPKKFLMVHAADGMQVEGLTFENIDILGEGQKHNYIEMVCGSNKYSKLKTAGFIKDITLKNVNLTGQDGGYIVLLRGFDDTHDIENVLFDNCSITGKPLTAQSPNLQIGKFTKDIQFK